MPGVVASPLREFWYWSKCSDPRSVGTQIDDSIMQKSLSAKILLYDKSYILVKSKVLDGRIFLTGKVDDQKTNLN